VLLCVIGNIVPGISKTVLSSETSQTAYLSTQGSIFRSTNVLNQTPETDEIGNYENNQQDALYRLIYYSKSALDVSGDVFAHH